MRGGSRYFDDSVGRLMVADGLIPMALFALATSATPGPVNVILAMTGARFGPWRSLPFVAGATTSFVAIMLLVGAGFGALIDWIEGASLVLTLCGSGYLLYVAYRIATGGGELTIDDTNDDRPGLISGFLVQAINPKAWIVSLSAIATFVAPQQAYVERLTIFAGLFFVICAASLTGWATVGHAAARLSGNVKAFNIVMATLLTISIGLILASEVINH